MRFMSRKEFRAAQQEAEDISQSRQNIPSYDFLLTQAAPRAGRKKICFRKGSEGSMGGPQANSEGKSKRGSSLYPLPMRTGIPIFNPQKSAYTNLERKYSH